MRNIYQVFLLLIGFISYTQTTYTCAIQGDYSLDEFGYSVSFSDDGNVFASSSPKNNSNTGYVRVYYWDSELASWFKKGNDIIGEDSGDLSGYSISLSSNGEIIAIGSPYNDGNLEDSGSVRVFQYNEVNSSWVQLGNDIDGEATEDKFGYSVSLSSDGLTFAAGSPFNKVSNTAGSVRIYSWNGENWNLGSEIDGSYSNERFGSSVSLSDDANKIAIGAPTYQPPSGSGFYTGRVETYMKVNNNWISVSPIFPSLYDNPGVIGDSHSFGWSVSLSGNGNVLLVGAP